MVHGSRVEEEKIEICGALNLLFSVRFHYAEVKQMDQRIWAIFQKHLHGRFSINSFTVVKFLGHFEEIQLLLVHFDDVFITCAPGAWTMRGCVSLLLLWKLRRATSFYLPMYMFLVKMFLALMILSMINVFLMMHEDLATFCNKLYSYSLANSGGISFFSKSRAWFSPKK